MAEPLFMDNPDFVVEERLIRELHLLNALGKGESEEAEAIADASEKPWYDLSKEEQNRIHGLSADLYQLTGEEIFEKTELSQEQLKATFIEAFQKENPERMLSLLRKGPTFLKDHQIAYFRWRCYQALRHVQSAVLFLEYAAKVAPPTDFYRFRILLMVALAKAGSKKEAIQIARGILADLGAHPYLKIIAAMLFEGDLESRTGQDAFNELRKLEGVLKNAIEELEADRSWPYRVKALVIGWLVLRRCYCKTGNPFLAKNALAQARALDPMLPAEAEHDDVSLGCRIGETVPVHSPPLHERKGGGVASVPTTGHIPCSHAETERLLEIESEVNAAVRKEAEAQALAVA
ncbi:MAG: hypothetical protein ABSE73_32770 [Planctomycetota bacterium]